jgi:hypothetical protein
MRITSAILRNVTESMTLALVTNDEFYLSYLQPVKNAQFGRDYLLKSFYWRHFTATWKLGNTFCNHSRNIFTHSCVAIKIHTNMLKYLC